ncbi:MAG: hypothetical protein WC455_27505 [Dehalococcoidia bacterium]|jgi:hypothetical protein
MIAPVVDAENWNTPHEIHTPKIQSKCGDVSISRYEDDSDTPVLISIGGGSCISLMIHVSNTDAVAIRDALNQVIQNEIQKTPTLERELSEFPNEGDGY